MDQKSISAQNLELWLLKSSLQTRMPVLVLASEVGKPEVSSLDTAGWQCQLPGCSVTAAETFVEDSVEEILSSVLLNKPSSTPEAEQ